MQGSGIALPQHQHSGNQEARQRPAPGGRVPGPLLSYGRAPRTPEGREGEVLRVEGLHVALVLGGRAPAASSPSPVMHHGSPSYGRAISLPPASGALGCVRQLNRTVPPSVSKAFLLCPLPFSSLCLFSARWFLPLWMLSDVPTGVPPPPPPPVWGHTGAVAIAVAVAIAHFHQEAKS